MRAAEGEDISAGGRLDTCPPTALSHVAAAGFPVVDASFGFAAPIAALPKEGLAGAACVLPHARTFERQPHTAASAWIGAAALALSLHAMLAAACFLTCAPEQSEDEIGAPAIEIAIVMAAPDTAPSDAPPGPESAASSAAPDSAQATPVAPAPEQQPAETAPTEDPVALVALPPQPDATTKPENARPESSQASVASVAAEETAAPAQDRARIAPIATAPVIGPGRSAERERANWERRLVAHLDRNKRYPAGQQMQNARVEVTFTIDRDGHVLSAEVFRTSGVSAYDEAALAMVRRADPTPPPPASIAGERLTFTAPVIFRTHGK